jgi:LuxR family transcriptional regulator, maltose regulon positive regulatory protein
MPVGDREMLVRARLVDRLRARWRVPVTVVVAPAGYGKTTLLAQAIAANETAPMGVDCWLACDHDTMTASTLGEGLYRAVELPFDPGRDVDEVAAAVTEARWAQSPRQVALVVDDVHEVPPGSEAADLLEAVVTSLPANGHVVLAGRLPPPVPLARLEVEGRVVRFDEADLVFTPEELTEFAALRGVPGSVVSPSGGWPAFAELSASRRSEVAGDYVGREVLSHLPAATRRDLAHLAHIGPFDDDLATAVLGRELDVAEILAGVPLVTTSPSGERLVHSLWQVLLADEVTPAEVAGARRQAAATLLRRGRVTAAVRLFIDAEAWEELAEAIIEALSAMRAPVPRDVLVGWLARLPADVRDWPSGRLLAAVLSDADPDEALTRFEECAAAFRSVGHAAGELACLVHLGDLAWWLDKSERVAAVVARVFELEARGYEEAAPVACIGRAVLFQSQNDNRRVLAELDQISPGSLHGIWRSAARAMRADALLRLGSAEEALEAVDGALPQVAPRYSYLIELARFEALWLLGRTDEILEALPALVQRIDDLGYGNESALAAAHCSLMHALRGDRDVADRYLDHANKVANSAGGPTVETAIAAAEAALAIAGGDEARARSVLEADLTGHRLGEGLSARAHQRSLALTYVLLPWTRPVWDAADLGPAFALTRDLARAVAAVRDDGALPPETRLLPDVGMVRARLPVAWLAELGVAAVAAGREDGSRLLGMTWPATRPAVVELAGSASKRRGLLRKAAREVLGQLAVPPTRRLELRLLGPLELRRGDRPVDATDWRRERVRSLLAYLVLHRTASREQVADALWPELDADGQSRNLRVTLTYVLRVLEPERGQRDASFFIRSHGKNISLHAGGWLDVDLWEFDEACAEAEEADRRHAPVSVLTHALRAVELWRGEPAELASEPWASSQIEQRRLRFAAVATRAGELLLAQGGAGRARALAERALAVDPWLEATHRLVVACHRAAGDTAAARRALGRFREAIAELGLDPDETTLMVERLVDDLPADGGG